MARRLRQVIDLYVSGKVAELADGTPVWVRALNPFEQDTARNHAQIAKARLTLAIKEHGSDEQDKVRHFFLEDGLDVARAKLADAKVSEAMPKILERMRIDPEWTEKLDILERGLDGLAKPPEPAEIELLDGLAEEYTAEITKRLLAEREYNEQHYASFEADALWPEYQEWYLARRGGELQLAEFRLYQVFYGARWCDGVKDEAGRWNHEACNGHPDQLFPTVDTVRSAPADLIGLLMDALDDVEMTVREAKNSDRQGSSSDSSPLPSEAAESSASTPEETPVAPPGS